MRARRRRDRHRRERHRPVPDARRLEREHGLRPAARVDRRTERHAARRIPCKPHRAEQAARLLRRELHRVRGPSADVRRLRRRDVRVLRRAGRGRRRSRRPTAERAVRLTLPGRKLDPVDRVRRRVVDRRLASLPDDLHVTRVRLQLEAPAAVVAHPEPPGGARHQRGADLAQERSGREQPVREADPGRDARGLGGGEPFVDRARKRLARAGPRRIHPLPSRSSVPPTASSATTAARATRPRWTACAGTSPASVVADRR